MLPIRIFVSLIFIDAVCGQCNGSPLTLTFDGIYGGQRLIQSPHYPNEYGSESHCTWDIIGPARPHILDLHIWDFRLHYRDLEKKRHCLPSYKLLINGERLGCKEGEFVFPGNDAPFFKTFRKCKALRRKLSINEVHSRPSIRIQFIADGSLPGAIASQYAVGGFSLSYTFHRCPEIHTMATTAKWRPSPPSPPLPLPTATKSTKANTQTSRKSVQTASEISKTKLHDWSKINLDNSDNGGIPVEEQQSNISTDSNATHATQGTDSIDPQASAESDNTGIILAASIAGGVLVILIIVVSWKIHRRRMAKKYTVEENKVASHLNLDETEFQPYSMAKDVLHNPGGSRKSEIPNQPVTSNGEKLVITNVAYEACWAEPSSQPDLCPKATSSCTKANILYSDTSHPPIEDSRLKQGS